MSLQFILGNSGFGKTTYIYDKIIKESIEHPELRYYCIVPEQFTLQTQRDFCLMHPRKGILNIDVLSFQRLAYHVLEEVGENGRMILEETGKNIVLRKLAKEKEDELKVLGRNIEKRIRGKANRILNIYNLMTCGRFHGREKKKKRRSC